MIVPMVLWSVLALVGCAAFAALGIWAHHTDEAFRARRVLAAQRVVVPAQQARPGGQLTLSAEEIGFAVAE